ncbi:MAG: ATP synthase F1 subunit gamma [Bacillota bacterium]
MSSMRDIKQRINATDKTSQITNAMHMVSASKLKKAERNIVNFRPLTKRLTDSLSRVLDSDVDIDHPMFESREVEKTVYILISSDRGLAGPYNAGMFKAFEKYVHENHGSTDEFALATLGFKAYSFAKRKGYTQINDKVIQVRDDIQFLDFQEISDTFIKGYLKGEYDQVVVFYNKFINTLNQQVKYETLLPLDKSPYIQGEEEDLKYKRMYHFEPSASTVLNQLLPMVIVNLLYGMILEAKASEHAARMTAMKSATDNAKDLIKDLKLHYNRARQNAITIELTDIIGGANAVN